MNKPQLTIGGVALGITIVIWLFAIHLMRQPSPIPPPSPPVPDLHGLLIPANDPTPLSECINEIPPDALTHG
jgi:hypothetical protein